MEGILVEMKDGSRYLLPKEVGVQQGLNWRREMGRLTKDDRKAAKDDMEKPMHPGDLNNLFAGTEWSEFQNVAVRLPDENLVTVDDMWSDAELTLLITPPTGASES